MTIISLFVRGVIIPAILVSILPWVYLIAVLDAAAVTLFITLPALITLRQYRSPFGMFRSTNDFAWFLVRLMVKSKR